MDAIWKTESAGSSALYVDLFENTSKLPTNLQRAPEKCNALSDKHRATGNGYFGRTAWADALECYNQSLCFAEPGSESMSLAYANRANCFLRLRKYDHCLADIELAIAANYPERLMAKLLERKANCLRDKRGGHKETGPTRAQLSYGEHATIPGLADVLELRASPEYGRHVVAASDIPVGKTVLVESSFTALTKRSAAAHCAACQNVRCNLVACAGCTVAMFCSAECLERGRAFHGPECGYVFNDARLDRSAQYVARSIFVALHACGGSVDELMAFVADARRDAQGMPASMTDAKDKYRVFLHLKFGLYHADAIQIILLQADFAYRIVMAMPAMAAHFDTLAKRRFLQHLIAMHLIILSKNSSSGLKYDANHVTSIGLVFSLFNHQCTSNLMNAGVGDTEVCITIRPVRKGEQMFVTYVTQPKPNQRRYIFDEFGFWCKCTRCVPAAVRPTARRLMERDEHLAAVNRILPFFDCERDVADRAKVKEHCIKFLNAHGHLPSNDILEHIVKVFKSCILYEYDY